MNILEFDNHLLSAIILHPRKQKIYRAVSCLGEKLDFFSPLGFEANCNFDYNLQIKATFNQSFRMIPEQ